MTDDKKPKPATEEADPVEVVASAVDNPAQTVLEATHEAHEAAEQLTAEPEPVEEVIEEHTPASDPITAGFDRLTAHIDESLSGINARLTALETKPNQQPEEVKEHAEQKPKSKKIKLLRGSRNR